MCYCVELMMVCWEEREVLLGLYLCVVDAYLVVVEDTRLYQ